MTFALLAASCKRPADSAGGFFHDATAASGIDFKLVNGASEQRRLIETMIGGLGWIDYDGDGDWDLFVTNGHSDSLLADQPGKETDRLYRNDGGGRFVDVTEAAGVGDPRYGCGVAVGDYDNDGRSDLLVTNFGRNTLYHNRGDGTFADVTEAAGLREEGWSTSAVWFDMDRDGDLDLYVTRYVRYHPATSKACREGNVYNYCHPRHFAGMPDLLYRNLGGGRFEEMGARAGIALAAQNEGKGLGVAAADFDRDGFLDLYVANDTTPNFLFHNNGDGTFRDVAQELGAALGENGQAQAGMGVDLADVNGDGWTDIHVTNFSSELNSLFLGSREGDFRERGRAAGLGPTYLALGFGTLLLDADLDGDPDIINANGHVNDIVERTDPGSGTTYRQRPGFYLNDGAGRFSEAGAAAGPIFQELMVGRGLAASDVDGDGDLDAALMTIDRGLVLLLNDAPRRPGVTLLLVGTRSPRDAYGARVEVTAGGKTRVFEYGSARSYLSACDPRLVVATGGAPRLDLVRIHWPSGAMQERRDLPAAGQVILREPE